MTHVVSGLAHGLQVSNLMLLTALSAAASSPRRTASLVVAMSPRRSRTINGNHIVPNKGAANKCCGNGDKVLDGVVE